VRSNLFPCCPRTTKAWQTCHPVVLQESSYVRPLGYSEFPHMNLLNLLTARVMQNSVILFDLNLSNLMKSIVGLFFRLYPASSRSLHVQQPVVVACICPVFINIELVLDVPRLLLLDDLLSQHQGTRTSCSPVRTLTVHILSRYFRLLHFEKYFLIYQMFVYFSNLLF